MNSGFVKLGNQLYGDVRASARNIAQNFTPVPGGVGPTEMAILMERLVRKELSPELESWRLEDRQPVMYLTRSQVAQQQLEWAEAIYPAVAAVFTQRLSEQPDSLIRNESGAIVLSGRNYSLSLNRAQGTFSVEGANNRGTLAIYSLSQGAVIAATGLTAIDAASWPQI